MKIFFVCFALAFFLLAEAFAMPKGEKEEVGPFVVRMPGRRLTEEKGALAPPAAQSQVPRPLAERIQIPEIARGYEEVYEKFVRGRLTYKPFPHSDAGRIDLPIRALVNPLEGEFDLSRCGDYWKHLSFSTGYRKGIRPGNAGKFELWIAPYFLIKRNLRTWFLFPGASAHLNPAMENWKPSKAPLGLFYTWGEADIRQYDYLISNSFEQLSDNNLYEKWAKAIGNSGFIPAHTLALCYKMQAFHLFFED